MAIYIAEFVGSGKADDPFHAYGVDWQNGGGHGGIIDLRPDGGATLDGGGLNACLLYSPDPVVGIKVYKVADDENEIISSLMIKNIESKLKLTADFITKLNLNEIIFDLLRNPPDHAWNPIKPSKIKAQYEVWLGGKLLKIEPTIVAKNSVTINEDFNGDDKSGIGYDHIWTEYDGVDWHNVSNEAKHGAASTNQRSGVRCDSVLDTDDHYCQAQFTAWYRGATNQYQDAGPLCRKDNTATVTYYYFRAHRGNGYAGFSLQKIIAGSGTEIDDNAEDPAPSQLIKISADGSTIKGYVDDVEKTSVTDTAITGNKYCGLHGGNYSATANYMVFDDWEAGDLAAGGLSIPLLMQQMDHFNGGMLNG